MSSPPIDINRPRKTAQPEHTELAELFNIKMRLTSLIDEYIQAKIDCQLKKYYDNLSIELANRVIEEIDKSTSKVAEKFMK